MDANNYLQARLLDSIPRSNYAPGNLPCLPEYSPALIRVRQEYTELLHAFICSWSLTIPASAVPSAPEDHWTFPVIMGFAANNGHRRAIDHLLLLGVPLSSVVAHKVVDSALLRKSSDHRAIFLDIKIATRATGLPVAPPAPKRRRTNLKSWKVGDAASFQLKSDSLADQSIANDVPFSDFELWLVKEAGKIGNAL